MSSYSFVVLASLCVCIVGAVCKLKPFNLVELVFFESNIYNIID